MPAATPGRYHTISRALPDEEKALTAAIKRGKSSRVLLAGRLSGNVGSPVVQLGPDRHLARGGETGQAILVWFDRGLRAVLASAESRLGFCDFSKIRSSRDLKNDGRRRR